MSDRTVTILIPARDEEADIERCLRAVLAQDHPSDRMEIVLVDGGSTDRTRSIAADVLNAGDIDWKIIDNPTGTTPSNLNAGLSVASGELLCRVDARSVVPREYVSRCASVLASRAEVAVTGGAQVAVDVNGSARSRGIARALNNRYAMGGSRYRSGASSGPTDTVYLGAFRTEQLRVAGGWDERMLTNQDFELNRRMSRVGVVWFDGELRVGYFPRQTFSALWRQYHRFGRWKASYWLTTGDRPQRRQLVLLVGPLLPALGFARVWSFSDRRTRRFLLLGSLAMPLGVDHLGSVERRAGLATRLHAAVAVAVVGFAWQAGVWSGLVLRGTRP